MKHFIYLLLLISPSVVFSQKVHPLPNQIDRSFADSILKMAIRSNTKIVVLGEENHGGELTNQINAEIITELVTKYGFKTLVFESDFFSLQLSNSLRNSTTFSDNIYSAWSKSVAFENINKLFLNGDLYFLGIDSRHHGKYARLYLVDYLKKNENEIHDFSESFYPITQSILENEFDDTLLMNHSEKYFTHIEKWQSKLKDSSEILFHVLTNLKHYAQQLIYERQMGPSEYVAYREVSMIENTAYLLRNKEQTEKYIFIGATLHLQPGITGLSEHASKNVGDYIFETYRDESVFIFPLVYSGEIQNYSFDKPQKVNKSGKRNSVQKELSKSNFFTLIDYCYNSRFSLYPSAQKLKNQEFCGHFVFIREEKPRLFNGSLENNSK